MKNRILLVFFFLVSGLCFGQAGSLYFRTKLDSILKKPVFDSTQIALSVFDLTDGVPVFTKNDKLLLRPASTLKIITTTAALQFLKIDYKFKTNLHYTGDIKDSTLTGDLYIEGGFDPEFKFEDLNTFIVGLKNSGVKKIKGNIYADLSKMDSLFWGKGWMWDDDSDKAFPYMNSLPINKNSVMVITSPSETGSMGKINVIPQSRAVTVINRTKTIVKDSSKISVIRNWMNRKNEIVITGCIGASSKPDTAEINIVYPERFFLSLFTDLLQKNNILFVGNTDTLKTPVNASVISTVTHTLLEAVNCANKDSDNLNAEMILRATAYEKLKRKISSADGIRLIDSLITITRFRKDNYRIVDGSGVSFYNLISAEMLIEILKFIRYQPELYKIISASLPIAGVDGTMAGRLSEFAHLTNINAKTGSLSGVSNLAGYITTTHGHVMAFVIYMQNFKGSAKRMRDFQDEICRAIYLIKSDKDE